MSTELEELKAEARELLGDAAEPLLNGLGLNEQVADEIAAQTAATVEEVGAPPEAVANVLATMRAAANLKHSQIQTVLADNIAASQTVIQNRASLAAQALVLSPAFPQ